ncbi:phytoene/squalene synthase family protein [Alicyclobacillus acidiphilus]|uniref:phytoene/squalene synthase family protein n=1 Tax=Alicyclobacillus acidiphilus TaxID=182455 RepID=UPI0008364C26|nr:phytoene/squalene synthase family protein [Alicyclobacillus acidiphilus]
MNVEQAYAYCAKATRQAGSSFFYGMRLLPSPKRFAMYAIYAWSRMCDDAVDDYQGEEAERQLAKAERMYQEAFGPDYLTSEEPIVVALGDSIRKFSLPKEPFDGLVRGMRMDMQQVQFHCSEELEEYCDCVAGTIGVLSVHVFGFRDPLALTLARDMGRALQLTNILRDLKEDLNRGRIYLPEEELGRHGYSVDDLVSRRRTPAFYQLMKDQVARAESYYQNAKRLFPLIDRDSLRCLRVLFLMYHELLEKIQQRGFDVFDQKVSLSSSRKLRLVWGALWNASATV